MPAAHSQLVQDTTCMCLDMQADAGRAGVMESMGPRDPGCGRGRVCVWSPDCSCISSLSVTPKLRRYKKKPEQLASRSQSRGPCLALSKSAALPAPDYQGRSWLRSVSKGTYLLSCS